MKKFAVLILAFLLIGINNSYAFSELYYLKGVKPDDIMPIIEDGYAGQKYNLIKKNPYYGTSKEGNNPAVIIIQQSGDNMFYYYMSDENTKINKSILSAVKKKNIVCEQSFNSALIGVYDNLAKTISATGTTEKQYNFEEESGSYFSPPVSQQSVNQNTYSGYVSKVPAGTKVEIYLQNAINTATAEKDDQVVAIVQNPLMLNGVVVIPQGSVVYGTLTKAKHATYGSQNGKVDIVFNRIVTPDNKTYDISTEKINFTVSNEGKVLSVVKGAAVGAVIGAAVGMLFALIFDNNVWHAAAIGAGVSAGSSAIYSTAERGVDAEIPSFTELEMVLKQPLNVTIGL